NNLPNKQVALILATTGLVVFFIGLASPFQGDDGPQIVDSAPVHSIANIGTLFSSSTFYNGQQLTGLYYRPMMTSVFALIYSLFGANSIPFHLVQLGIYVAAAFILYLV